MLEPEVSVPERRGRPALLSHAGLIVMLLYFGWVYGGVLFLTEGATERDSFYHARYSQLLPQRGLSRQLPWMQFTLWKDQFCDKDFLYHVLLAPFCTNAVEPLPGAKLATLLLLLAVLAATYAVLRAWKAPFALVWTALLATGGAYFLTRMFMVRSHTLSVLLMVLTVHLALKRCRWGCFLLGFVYSWSYSTPIAMPIAVCAAEAGRLILDRDWRAASICPLLSMGGVLAGLVLHPYTPYSLTSMAMFFRIIWSGATTSPVELGSEFRRMELGPAFTTNAGTTLAAVFAAGGAVWLQLLEGKRRRLASETAAAVGISTAWLAAMLVFFERFIEYAAPCACIALGLVVRDLIAVRNASAGESPILPTRPNRVLWLGAAGVAALALISLHSWTLELNYAFLASQQRFFPSDPEHRAWHRGRFFDGAANWMRTNLQPGTVVANFHWDDFPELFYAAPQDYYLVGLDPTFMWIAYPRKAEVLEDMRTGKIPFSPEKIREVFGTDYMVVRKNKIGGIFDPKAVEIRTRIVFEDAHALILRCTPFLSP